MRHSPGGGLNTRALVLTGLALILVVGLFFLPEIHTSLSGNSSQQLAVVLAEKVGEPRPASAPKSVAKPVTQAQPQGQRETTAPTRLSRIMDLLENGDLDVFSSGSDKQDRSSGTTDIRRVAERGVPQVAALPRAKPPTWELFQSGEYRQILGLSLIHI